MTDINNFSEIELDRIIEMAWEDRTTFDAIKIQFGLTEKDVIALMRKQMKGSSFKMWRKRVCNRASKHAALKNKDISRFRCDRQRGISQNKISKR